MKAVRKVRSYKAAWQRARRSFLLSKLSRPVVCLPTELFQGCFLEPCVIQPGGTMSSFQCPTGDS